MAPPHTNNRQRHVPPPAQREAIVDKLHGALATFRRERDEVHRAKELAVERLRLAREEREVAERTIQSMQEKYDQLVKSVSSKSNGGIGTDDEILKLQGEVERLSREARFQHGELVSKREKMDQLQSSMEEEEIKRSGYLRLARDAVRTRREKIALREAEEDSNMNGSTEIVSGKHNNNNAENDESIRKVLQSSSGDEQELYSKLQRLIEKNAADVASEIESITQKSNTTSRRIAGYTRFINSEGGNVENRLSTFGMKQ